MLFADEWREEGIRKLAETTDGSLDYVVTGAIQRRDDVLDLVVRVWEVARMKERKQFTASWAPGAADADLVRLHAQIRSFMEWSAYPDGRGIPYVAPATPQAWLDGLGASLGLFLLEKKLIPRPSIPPLDGIVNSLSLQAADFPAASLAWLTLRSRAAFLEFPLPQTEPTLSDHPSVEKARRALGR